MRRVYSFEFPFVISSFYVSMGMNRLQSNGILDALPVKLRNTIISAYNQGESVTLTRQDCDSIDNETWEKIAQLLNLTTSYEIEDGEEQRQPDSDE